MHDHVLEFARTIAEDREANVFVRLHDDIQDIAMSLPGIKMANIIDIGEEYVERPEYMDDGLIVHGNGFVDRKVDLQIQGDSRNAVMSGAHTFSSLSPHDLWPRFFHEASVCTVESTKCLWDSHDEQRYPHIKLYMTYGLIKPYRMQTRTVKTVEA